MSGSETKRTIPAWAPMAILVFGLAVVLVAWWTVAAGLHTETLPVPGVSQPVAAPSPTSPSRRISTRPQTMRSDVQIDLYLDQDQPKPRILAVPRNQQPPQTSTPLSRLSIPARFRFEGKLWQASGETLSGPDLNMQAVEADVEGYPLLAKPDAKPPYDHLYLETEQGSGVFADFRPAS